MALESINPQKYTFGYIYLLAAKCIVPHFDANLFIYQFINLVNICNLRQLRLDLKKFKLICQKFVDVCIKTRQAMRAIMPLKQAINKIVPSPQLTSLHYMLVLCCLKSKNYKAALSVLETNVCAIDSAKSEIESVDVRLYFYYGGMIYTGLKSYKKAQEFFFNVVSFPAFVTSEIMVEAYKKYILVSLLNDGSVPSISRFASNSFIRLVKQKCAAYEDIANSYGLHSLEDIQKCISKNTELFLKDNNLGLVSQVRKSLYKKNIANLTKTYLTLSVGGIAEKVHLDNKEVEETVLTMIRDRQVFASINQKDGMVSFSENPNQYDTVSTLSYLDNNIQQIVILHDTTKNLDETIAVSPQYIQKVVTSERSRFSPMMADEGFDIDAGSGFRG